MRMPSRGEEHGETLNRAHPHTSDRPMPAEPSVRRTRRKTAGFGSLAVVSALALSACGGSGSTGSESGHGPNPDQLGNTGDARNASAKGPATIPDARKGGIVTVLAQYGLGSTLDPSEAYTVDTSSIMSGLVTRSLTQYKYDPSTKQMVLVPDLATNLGQHNDNYAQWTFTIRPGVKWENGQPVTAMEIAWGMTRCMDAATFPTGACQYYSDVYFKGGSSYGGPYTSKQKPGTIFSAIKVNGNTITINMAKPFPDMPYWGTFPANGPIPLGNAANPKTYKSHPLSTGPYKIKSFSPSKELVLVRNTQWDPKTDPARTQYPDGYDFKTQQQSEKIDQILLADSGAGQTTLTYDNLLAPDYLKMQQTASDRLTLGGTPCTYYWAPDNRKITNIKVREALAWAYPYKNVILASGLIPGVTAIPATNLMPPGVPGRTPYNVTSHHAFQTNPDKAKSLLTSANALGFEIRFLFPTDDPIQVKVKDALVEALTAAGFKATPVPTTMANYATARGSSSENINVRAGGWCSDWPSGSTWIPNLYGSTNPDETNSLGANYSALNNKAVDNQINAIRSLPLDQQAAAWNNLDETVAQKYFPLFTTWYGGIAQAHGSKIHGDFDDVTVGMPTWKDMWISP
jgi:peptide/nickel transport system substrate-binding protein